MEWAESMKLKNSGWVCCSIWVLQHLWCIATGDVNFVFKRSASQPTGVGTTNWPAVPSGWYDDIADVPDYVDIIEIFRPSDQVMPIIKEAIKKNPKVIWLQEGIHNKEAEKLAHDVGIDVIFNRCMLAEHRRLT